MDSLTRATDVCDVVGDDDGDDDPICDADDIFV